MRATMEEVLSKHTKTFEKELSKLEYQLEFTGCLTRQGVTCIREHYVLLVVHALMQNPQRYTLLHKTNKYVVYVDKSTKETHLTSAYYHYRSNLSGQSQVVHKYEYSNQVRERTPSNYISESMYTTTISIFNFLNEEYLSMSKGMSTHKQKLKNIEEHFNVQNYGVSLKYDNKTRVMESPESYERMVVGARGILLIRLSHTPRSMYYLSTRESERNVVQYTSEYSGFLINLLSRHSHVTDLRHNLGGK